MERAIFLFRNENVEILRKSFIIRRQNYKKVELGGNNLALHLLIQ